MLDKIKRTYEVARDGTKRVYVDVRDRTKCRLNGGHDLVTTYLDEGRCDARITCRKGCPYDKAKVVHQRTELTASPRSGDPCRWVEICLRCQDVAVQWRHDFGIAWPQGDPLCRLVADCRTEGCSATETTYVHNYETQYVSATVGEPDEEWSQQEVCTYCGARF